MRIALLALSAVLLAPLAALTQSASPHAVDIPSWFSETFLDLREDSRDAAKEGKRLMVYFGQESCPYCKALMQTNFSQPRIVGKTRRHVIALALNIWGDRPVTGFDGAVMRDKDFARAMGVQFTPTVIEVIRIEAYLRPFHLAGAFAYVSSGAFRNEPSFQRFIKARAERLRQRGQPVDLWK
ncbi:MAG: thioredoxin fold domain-containing protein [Betaproteobacteria bacterium]|nr:thioredoxin fold domain-containing protein [Betaproteobacteria bacterium]